MRRKPVEAAGGRSIGWRHGEDQGEGTVVELDGDEMTRIIWQFIKDRLIQPYLDVDLEYYDLGIESRDATEDQITIDAANAIKKHGVGVKCATITPGRGAGRGVRPQEDVGVAQRHDPQHPGRRRLPRADHHLATSRGWCPAGPSRSSIGRHAHGDQYKATNFKVPGAGQLTITFTPDDGGEPIEHVVVRLRRRRRRRDGHVQLQRVDRATSPGHRSRYGLQREYPVYLSTKNTILKAYDGAFKDIFRRCSRRSSRPSSRPRG